jgi:Rrf2 family protein
MWRIPDRPSRFGDSLPRIGADSSYFLPIRRIGQSLWLVGGRKGVGLRSGGGLRFAASVVIAPSGVHGPKARQEFRRAKLLPHRVLKRLINCNDHDYLSTAVVNQQFAFAVHILAVLGHSGGVVGSRTVAASVDTNPVVVRRLLLALRDAGLIKTCTGNRGGSSLAKSPDRISLLDIYNAVDQRPVIGTSRRKVFRECSVSCNMQRIMRDVSGAADRALRQHLQTITLRQILRKIR